MRTPHSSTNKGKRVKITTRDGEVWVGKFKDKKSSTIWIEDGKMINSIDTWVTPIVGFHMSNVRAFSIYKPTK